MLRNWLEEDMCLYRPNARWGGEFEWLKRLSKNHSRRIAENSWVSESENLKKNGQTAPSSPHVVWEGSKKDYSCSSKNKNKFQHIQSSDMTGTSNGSGFYDRMKQKICFLAANTQYGFGEHRDKSTPICTMMLWAYISAGGPGHLV